jgi:hypothetical protein
MLDFRTIVEMATMLLVGFGTFYLSNINSQLKDIRREAAENLKEITEKLEKKVDEKDCDKIRATCERLRAM